jgi:hypothetical protein
MSNVYPFHEVDEGFEAEELFLEAEEGEEGEEGDEAARRSRRRFRAPIRTPRRGGSVAPRPAAGFATRAELMATAGRLDAKIAVASTGIKALDGRVRTLDTDNGKLRSALSAESKKREALAGQINGLQQMSMLMPLLSRPATKTVGRGGVANTTLVSGDKIVVESTDMLPLLLPMLLSTGGGSSGQPGSGGMFGGDSNSMLPLIMVMALAK